MSEARIAETLHMKRRNIKRDELGRRTDKVKPREKLAMVRMKLRESLTCSEIANKIGRDPRTVRKVLEEAAKSDKGTTANHAVADEIVELKTSSVESHHEDVRKAVADWLALIRHPKPLFPPMMSVDPTHFGFGLTWEIGPDGISAKLVAEGKASYSLLRAHLSLPVVDDDFWKQVEGLKAAGTDFLLAWERLDEQISRDSQNETGVGTTVHWRHIPETGITSEFTGTIARNALGVEQCVSYSYSEAALAYLDSGYIVTNVSEGLGLLQGRGLDPSLMTLYVSTGGSGSSLREIED